MKKKRSENVKRNLIAPPTSGRRTFKRIKRDRRSGFTAPDFIKRRGCCGHQISGVREIRELKRRQTSRETAMYKLGRDELNGGDREATETLGREKTTNNNRIRECTCVIF